MSRLIQCSQCKTLSCEDEAHHILKCGMCGKQALRSTPLIDMTPVAPSATPYKRAMPWRVFERRFLPIAKSDGSYVWEKWEIPKDADYREWWTLVDPMTGGGRWYLAAGFHLVNRVGFVRCAVPWGGEWDEHPEYVY